MESYFTDYFKNNDLEEKKNLLIKPSDLWMEDLRSLKRIHFNRAKKVSEEAGNNNYYEGKRFENECWEFFKGLDPDSFNHPFKNFKFDLSAYKKYQKGEGRRSYQKSKQTDLIFFYGNHIFVIECKSTKQGLSSESLSQEIELFMNLNHFKTSRIKTIFGDEYIPVYIVCTKGFNLDSKDQEDYLKDNKVILLDEKRREYIQEVLVSSGSAEFALNQFLGFFRKDEPDFNKIEKKSGQKKKKKWTIDAYHSLSGKKKKHKVYTFSISPEEMLKVSTVAHQKINNIFEAEQSVTKRYYQRLLTSNRLKSLGKHLNEKSTPFPNNILVSYRGKTKLNFDPTRKRSINVGNTPGKLSFNACPGTFHVIDGQHRLFGYTQVEKKIKGIRESHRLIVTCFDGLDVSEEADVFLEVNQNAKPIAPALLMEIEFASGAVSETNICNGVVFELRDEEKSALYKHIRQAEGKGAKTGLNVKNLQTALKSLEIINGDNYEQGIFWEEDMYKTINIISKVINSQFQIFKDKNKSKWKGKAKKGIEPGVLQDIFVSGLLGVFDRILMEVFKQNPRLGLEDFILATKELTLEFSNNFKKEQEQQKNKMLNISDFFGLGSSSPPLVTAYLVDRYLSNNNALKRKGDEEKLYIFGTESFDAEEIVKLVKENDKLKKELEEKSKQSLKEKNRNHRGMAYSAILKDIIHLTFSREEHYGIDYWSSFVMRGHWKKDNVWDDILTMWNQQKKDSGEEAYSHPIAFVEGINIKNLVSMIPRHRQVRLKNNQDDRIMNTIKFIWENLIIPPKGVVMPKKIPKDNDAFWNKGTKYISLFAKFRNTGVGEELITTHRRPQGVTGNPTKPLEEDFDYYEEEFLKKLPKLIESLDLVAAKDAIG